MGVLLVDGPLGNRGETHRAATATGAIQHTLTDQFADGAGHVLAVDAGHLGDNGSSNARHFHVVAHCQAVDGQGYPELPARQIGPNQGLIQVIVHTGEPLGLVQLHNVAHTEISIPDVVSIAPTSTRFSAATEPRTDKAL
ncbi:hypothetical protein D3C78_1597720 [compost metagenome]